MSRGYAGLIGSTRSGNPEALVAVAWAMEALALPVEKSGVDLILSSGGRSGTALPEGARA